MKLYLGQVNEDDNRRKNGYLSVTRFDTDRVIIDTVVYTSPFGSKFTPAGRSGFYAFPSPGQYILYAESDSITREYFYISTVHKDYSNKNRKKSDKVKGRKFPNAKNIQNYSEDGLIPRGLYNTSGEPQKIVIQDPKGNKITLNHKVDDEEILLGISLVTGSGKRLNLSDSPEGDAVRLLNEKGDGVIIAGEYKVARSAGALTQPREVRVKSRNSVNVISEKGKIKLNSVTGKGIELEAAGIGMDSLLPTLNIAGPLPSMPVGGPLFQPYGNIKLESKFRDVCLMAGRSHKEYQQTLGVIVWPPEFHRSRVMLRAYGTGGKVQILSDGSVIIKATNDSVYIHGGDIHIKGENSVNIHSKGNINMNAGGSIRMTGGDVANATERVFTDEFSEVAFDSSENARRRLLEEARVDPAAAFGHLEVYAGGVAASGRRIDLAPAANPLANSHEMIYAMASFPPDWELSDYEINIQEG